MAIWVEKNVVYMIKTLDKRNGALVSYNDDWMCLAALKSLTKGTSRLVDFPIPFPLHAKEM